MHERLGCNYGQTGCNPMGPLRKCRTQLKTEKAELLPHRLPLITGWRRLGEALNP
jgi:hypothetical protein